jgi:hypothetical protein
LTIVAVVCSDLVSTLVFTVTFGALVLHATKLARHIEIIT